MPFGVCAERGRPACCAAVENFVHARHRDEHKRKVSAARSIINNGWSVREERRLETSRRNVKREQVSDDRYANIERENLRLLQKMQEIDRRDLDIRRDVSGGGLAKTPGRVLLGTHGPGPKQGIAKSSSLPAMGRGSNQEARMREMRRIDEENRRILKRISGAKSSVNRKKLEEQHREQQRIMNMRQEHGTRMPRQGPLPFSAVPASVDPESQRLQDLHEQLQRKLEDLEEQELEDLEKRRLEVGASPCRTPASFHSPKSALAENDPGNACPDASEQPDAEREFIAGKLPEHSRTLVEQLMLERFPPESPRDEVLQQALESSKSRGPQEASDAKDIAEDAKEAAADMLKKAMALDAQEFDPLGGDDNLSYENVVQRSRARLQAAEMERGYRQIGVM